GAVRNLDAGGVEPGHDRAGADLLAAGHAREGVGHRDGETLLAHHENGHALFSERVVHRARGIAADPGNALGLEDPREAVDRFHFHRAPPGVEPTDRTDFLSRGFCRTIIASSVIFLVPALRGY